MSDDIEINVKGLDALIKALKGKLPIARVGVLEGATPRTGASEAPQAPTNAQIGAWHEFGTTKMPVRSFLRLPLTTQLNRYLAKSGILSQAVLKEVLKTGNLRPVVAQLAVVGETIVLDAFDSGGFGTWPAHAPGYQNNTGDLLQNTQQLRNSISSEVVDP